MIKAERNEDDASWTKNVENVQRNSFLRKSLVVVLPRFMKQKYIICCLKFELGTTPYWLAHGKEKKNEKERKTPKTTTTNKQKQTKKRLAPEVIDMCVTYADLAC